MRNIAIRAALFLLLFQGGVFAHEGEMHGMHMEDAQMKKLHSLMPMFAQAQVKINEALTKKDAKTVGEETGKILAAIPDLKKSQPHKNLKQIKTFRNIASTFAGDIKKTAALAKAGDFSAAREAFRAAQIRCNECHKKFRD